MAWGLLIPTDMFRSCLLLLLVAASPAWGQGAPEQRTTGTVRSSSSASPSAATTNAAATVVAGEQRVAQLARASTVFRQTLDRQVGTIDRLKRGPRGWRTKAQLEDRLAEAHETGEQIKAIEAQLLAARQQLAAARRSLVAAIDAELRYGGVTGTRTKELTALRAMQMPPSAARRIVLPDTRIDPRLDPEELDEQVAAIRESEAVLDRQIRGLEDQGKELTRVAELRKEHDRMIELDKRDDNASRRAVQPQTPRFDSQGPPTPTGGPERRDFESDASIVLPEVVDSAVLDGIVKAKSSGDPGRRAAAVRKAHDAVVAKRDQLRRQRLEIEKLARQRRLER